MWAGSMAGILEQGFTQLEKSPQERTRGVIGRARLHLCSESHVPVLREHQHVNDNVNVHTIPLLPRYTKTFCWQLRF